MNMYLNNDMPGQSPAPLVVDQEYQRILDKRIEIYRPRVVDPESIDVRIVGQKPVKASALELWLDPVNLPMYRLSLDPDPDKQKVKEEHKEGYDNDRDKDDDKDSSLLHYVVSKITDALGGTF